jgi:hypothetical protein
MMSVQTLKVAYRSHLQLGHYILSINNTHVTGLQAADIVERVATASSLFGACSLFGGVFFLLLSRLDGETLELLHHSRLDGYLVSFGC